MATSSPASENLIRKVDDLLRVAEDANAEIDDAIGVLLRMDSEKRWDGYIIGSDSPLNIVSADIRYLRDELDRLAMDLRTIGIE